MICQRDWACMCPKCGWVVDYDCACVEGPTFPLVKPRGDTRTEIEAIAQAISPAPILGKGEE